MKWPANGPIVPFYIQTHSGSSSVIVPPSKQFDTDR